MATLKSMGVRVRSNGERCIFQTAKGIIVQMEYTDGTLRTSTYTDEDGKKRELSFLNKGRKSIFIKDKEELKFVGDTNGVLSLLPVKMPDGKVLHFSYVTDQPLTVSDGILVNEEDEQAECIAWEWDKKYYSELASVEAGAKEAVETV